VVSGRLKLPQKAISIKELRNSVDPGEDHASCGYFGPRIIGWGLPLCSDSNLAAVCKFDQNDNEF
jgi:hypothetical protein